MQQQLAAPLPEQDAEQWRTAMLPGQTSEHLQGTLGAVLHLCAALDLCCASYIGQEHITSKTVTKQFASDFNSMGLLRALGVVCAAVAEALEQQQQQQQRGVQCSSKRRASTYAEEAAQVLLWLVQRLCLSWPSKMLYVDCWMLTAVQPAVTLAATVLRVCSASLQPEVAAAGFAVNLQLGCLQDNISGASSSSSDASSGNGSSVSGQEGVSSSDKSGNCDDNTSSSSSSSSSSSDGDHVASSARLSSRGSSVDCMSKSLLAARFAALKVATWLSLSFSYEVNRQAPEATWARKLVASDGLLVLLQATMARVAYFTHKQALGQSPVPPPADDWNSSSSGSASRAGAAEDGVLNRQQRRLQQRDQQRQQQRQMLRVPPFHKATLFSVGLTDTDLVGSELGANPFGSRAKKAERTIMHALCAVLGMRSGMLQQRQEQQHDDQQQEQQHEEQQQQQEQQLKEQQQQQERQHEEQQVQQHETQEQQQQVQQHEEEEQQQQQVQLAGPFPPQLYPSFMLLCMELLVLVPDLPLMRNGLDTLLTNAAQRRAAEQGDGASTATALPAAMAVAFTNGQRYQGSMLVQPLLQLVVPAVQHLLDSSAAAAAMLPAAHEMVQQRVACVAFLSGLLINLLNDGRWRACIYAMRFTASAACCADNTQRQQQQLISAAMHSCLPCLYYIPLSRQSTRYNRQRTQQHALH
jgi:hypothetical protein